MGYRASLGLPWVKSPEASGNTGDYPTSKTVKQWLHMARYWAQSVPGLDSFTMKEARYVLLLFEFEKMAYKKILGIFFQSSHQTPLERDGPWIKTGQSPIYGVYPWIWLIHTHFFWWVNLSWWLVAEIDSSKIAINTPIPLFSFLFFEPLLYEVDCASISIRSDQLLCINTIEQR